MEFETLLFAAIQISFLLGLLHGVNPRGYTWLVLIPFVSSEESRGRVALLTSAFLGGALLACIVLGAILGGFSKFVPIGLETMVQVVTSFLLLGFGVLLVYRPELLDIRKIARGEASGQYHTHPVVPVSWKVIKKLHELSTDKKMLPIALFGIGFVNMLIPSPMAAVMYGFALNAESGLASTLVFCSYALSTAFAVSFIVILTAKVARMTISLQRDWIEPLLMRIAGVLIALFSLYGIVQAFF